MTGPASETRFNYTLLTDVFSSLCCASGAAKKRGRYRHALFASVRAYTEPLVAASNEYTMQRIDYGVFDLAASVRFCSVFLFLLLALHCSLAYPQQRPPGDQPYTPTKL